MQLFQKTRLRYGPLCGSSPKAALPHLYTNVCKTFGGVIGHLDHPSTMKLKQLEIALSDVDSFDDPKIELEQFPTSAHLAARMIYVACNTYNDIEGKIIGDFGCGPGILSIGCSYLGATHVIGFDIDQDALDTCWVNLRKLDITNIDLIHTSIPSLQLTQKFDTVVMNPPFGTRNAGIDTIFVAKGLEYADVVYSLHKSSTREHFYRFANENNCNVEVVAELRYDIPKMYKHHKAKSKDIEVDLLRFSRK